MTINTIQKETLKDTISKLNKHHKCLLVRPTGFGKTKTSIDIIKRYKHAIFLYPFNNIGMSIQKYNAGNLDLHLYTYAKLRNLHKYPDEFKRIFSKFNLKNTIFIMDEAHFIGSVGTSKVIEDLMNNICPNANYLGITATPNRTDKLDIKWHFFDGITAYEYGLYDAFKDNIFTKPYYVYTPLNGTELEKSLMNKIDNMQVSDAKKEQLKSRIRNNINPQKLNIENLDEIIENNLDKFKNDIDYYKFILFFTTHNDIHNKQQEIVSAFQKVFPHCDINVVIVSSESNRFRLNLGAIQNLNRRKNTIDLIFNVNMLTFGYHVNDITGIMMFRQTISNIIYIQQIGRCISVVQKESTIIFDFVENLHRTSSGIINFDDNSSSLENINSIGILLPVDDVILDERSKEILDIGRLINCVITEEFEEEVVNAYKIGLVDMDYCISKLQLVNADDFIKILRRYE